MLVSPLLMASDWLSPPLVVLDLWAGCPHGLKQARGSMPGGQQQPGTVMLMSPRVWGTPEVPWLGTSVSHASMRL